MKRISKEANFVESSLSSYILRLQSESPQSDIFTYILPNDQTNFKSFPGQRTFQQLLVYYSKEYHGKATKITTEAKKIKIKK